MKIRSYWIIASFMLVANTYALTPKQMEHEDSLTQLATARCNSELIEGKDFDLDTMGNGKIGFSLRGGKYAGLEGTFVTTLEKWEGRRRVLIEHQANENANRRECIREELKALRDSYIPPK